MGRTPCCAKSGLKKGPWTPEEDQKLLDYIHKHGDGSWRTLPKNAGLERCGKSCRLRWTNYLRPDIKRGRFSFEEEEIIIQLHSVLGNKWSAIAARLPGRTDNEIKNYWNTHIRKKLLRVGIDPVTHTPRLDLLDISSILSSSLYNNSRSSHQFNASRPVLGVQPVVNPQVLQLVTTLLSTQRDHHQNPELVQQNFQENQLGQPDHQFQLNQFHQSFQLNQQVLQPTIEDENQLMQANVQQFESSFTSNFGCQDSNWLFDTAGMAQPNYGYFVPDESINNFVSEISNFQSNKYCNNQHCNFASVLSTPSSSPTPLNSSSTHINSSTEDDKDSYCSDRLMFEIPVLGMYVNGFM